MDFSVVKSAVSEVLDGKKKLEFVDEKSLSRIVLNSKLPVFWTWSGSKVPFKILLKELKENVKNFAVFSFGELPSSKGRLFLKPAVLETLTGDEYLGKYVYVFALDDRAVRESWNNIKNLLSRGTEDEVIALINVPASLDEVFSLAENGRKLIVSYNDVYPVLNRFSLVSLFGLPVVKLRFDGELLELFSLDRLISYLIDNNYVDRKFFERGIPLNYAVFTEDGRVILYQPRERCIAEYLSS